jgi:hypothetical protein
MLPRLKIRNEGGGESKKRKTARGLLEMVPALLYTEKLIFTGKEVLVALGTLRKLMN